MITPFVELAIAPRKYPAFFETFHSLGDNYSILPHFDRQGAEVGPALSPLGLERKLRGMSGEYCSDIAGTAWNERDWAYSIKIKGAASAEVRILAELGGEY